MMCYYLSKKTVVVSVFFLLLCIITTPSASSNTDIIHGSDEDKVEAFTTENEDVWVNNNGSSNTNRLLWRGGSSSDGFLFTSQPELYDGIRDPSVQNRFLTSETLSATRGGSSTRGGAAAATARNKYDDDITKAVQDIVKETMDVFGLTGVSVGLIEKDKVIFSDGFGYADKEKGVRATDQTHYHIASMTKAFTSMLLATYADDPLVKLSLDVPVRSEDVFYDNSSHKNSPLFPEWKMDDDEATLGATLRDMLNHRTGLPRHDFLGFTLASSKEDLLHRLAGLESDHPFRTSPGEYNNIMFALAGLAAERLEASKTKPDAYKDKASSSSSWEDLVKMKVFDVLNMTDTFPSLDDFGDRKTLARGYFQGTPIPKDSNNLHHVTTPAGGVISNVSDMLKWAQLHLRQWNRLFKSNRRSNDIGPYLVSDEIYYENFGQSQTVFPCYTELDTYSNGWWHVPQHGTGNKLVTHGGNLNGFSLAIGLLPNPVEEVGNGAVIVLTNENGSMARDSLLMKLSELLQERAGYAVPPTSKIDWDQLFAQTMRDYAARSAEEDEAIEDRIAHTPASGKTPLLDLGAYVGSYVDVNGGYGRFDISDKHLSKDTNDLLYLTIDDVPWEDGGELSVSLGHMYFETFRVCDLVQTEECENEIQFTFENDGYGCVTGMKAYGLEPQVVITFEKAAVSSGESSNIGAVAF